MIPQLDPGLLLLIAQHVKAPIRLIEKHVPSIENAIVSDKATLLNLMKASKVSMISKCTHTFEADAQTMYNICAPVLYQDCVTDDYASFASGLRTNENTDRTRRLHIYNQRHASEASYVELLTEDCWALFVGKVELDSVPANVSITAFTRENDVLVREGTRLRQFVTEGPTVLPNLNMVSMGGIGERLYNGHSAASAERLLHIDYDNNCKTIAPALLDLPSVQHYCQAVSMGRFHSLTRSSSPNPVSRQSLITIEANVYSATLRTTPPRMSFPLRSFWEQSIGTTASIRSISRLHSMDSTSTNLRISFHPL